MRFARWSNSKSVNDLLLLETTCFIDAERTDAELDRAIHDANDVAIAAITVVELQAGLRLAPGRRRAQGQLFIDELCNVIPILAYDRSVSAEHGDPLVAVREAGRPRVRTTSSSTCFTPPCGLSRDLVVWRASSR